jgi:DNA replicative helicase MCM subunit Mcm2 (Cdc46/Mcm family)
VQELPDQVRKRLAQRIAGAFDISALQVPVGHIPRSMIVVCRGETSRQVVPGDIITIDGIFLPTPFSGKALMTASLLADTYVEAHKARIFDFDACSWQSDFIFQCSSQK